MGTMIRLLNAVADNDSLEIFPIPYTGVPGAKFVSETRISANLSRDISGNRVPVTLQGTPSFSDGYIRGGGGSADTYKWLKGAYAPAANSSRTMCVVARYVTGGAGNAFALSDNNGQAGCSLFIGTTDGWRGQVLVTNGSAVSGVFPAPLPNLPVMEKTDWHFAVLVIDAENRTASFKLPALGYSTSATWTADKTIPVGAGELRIAGTSAAAADSCDVAFATYHDRALTESEILQQYYAAKAYCDAVGVDLV
ncbi:hypothetical protein [Klebsiella pneumoniae]|uniref:hypothetical protein n=1 Tax=Klebsiella pneumoniae TaxID=573 RepID=UPI00192B1006|nr:hypothetical protein [Klebsiella pneumoniae]MBL4510445.1 hypothetical protein [Klebsiella pneumoniae]